MNGESDAVIGNTALRIVVGANALASITRADLTAAVGSNGIGLLALLLVIEDSAQHTQGFILVFELTAFLLTFNHNTRWLVRKTNGRLGLVDVLTARAAGFAGFKNEVGRVDLNRDLFRLGENGNGCR